MTARDSNSIHVINSLAIQRLSVEEMEKHRGQYAVLFEGEIVNFYETNREALAEGCSRFRDGQFSVQRVEPQPVDMGFTDCANYPR